MKTSFRIIYLMPALLMVIAAGAGHAQVVLAPAGDNYENGAAKVSFTLGEPVVATLSADSTQLTQGYQQTYLEIVGVADDFPEIAINVFPNPTREIAVITSSRSSAEYALLLLDANGQMIQVGKLSDGRAEVDLRSQPAGTYMLNVLSEDRRVKTYKIVKIN